MGNYRVKFTISSTVCRPSRKGDGPSGAIRQQANMRGLHTVLEIVNSDKPIKKQRAYGALLFDWFEIFNFSPLYYFLAAAISCATFCGTTS
jgi:hypothetical protein